MLCLTKSQLTGKLVLYCIMGEDINVIE